MAGEKAAPDGEDDRGPDGEAERREGEEARVLICDGSTREARGLASADCEGGCQLAKGFEPGNAYIVKIDWHTQSNKMLASNARPPPV